jgi:DNA-directed RNA polymerase specialized sigma24 family protein
MNDGEAPACPPNARTPPFGRGWLQRVRGMVLRHRLPSADLPDVTQEVALAVWAAHRSDEARASDDVIARNKVVDHLRGARHQARPTFDERVPTESPASDPAAVVEARDFLVKMGASLSAEEWQAVYLHLVEHQSYAAIAELQGVSDSLATNRVRTGCNKIRRAVEKERECGVVAFPALLAALFGREPYPEGSPDIETDGPLAHAESQPPESSVAPAGAGGWAVGIESCAPRRAARLAVVALALTLCGLVRQHEAGPRDRPAAALGVAAAPIAATGSAGRSVAEGASPSVSPAAVATGHVQPVVFPVRQARPGGHREERVLLERASAALNHDDPGVAFALCAQHATRFPTSAFAVERASTMAEACARSPAGADVPGMKDYCAGSRRAHDR